MGHLALQKTRTSQKQRPSTSTLNSLLYSLRNPQLTKRDKFKYTPEVMVNQGEFPPTEVIIFLYVLIFLLVALIEF